MSHFYQAADDFPPPCLLSSLRPNHTPLALCLLPGLLLLLMHFSTPTALLFSSLCPGSAGLYLTAPPSVTLGSPGRSQYPRLIRTQDLPDSRPDGSALASDRMATPTRRLHESQVIPLVLPGRGDRIPGAPGPSEPPSTVSFLNSSAAPLSARPQAPQAPVTARITPGKSSKAHPPARPHQVLTPLILLVGFGAPAYRRPRPVPSLPGHRLQHFLSPRFCLDCLYVFRLYFS